MNNTFGGGRGRSGGRGGRSGGRYINHTNNNNNSNNQGGGRFDNNQGGRFNNNNNNDQGGRTIGGPGRGPVGESNYPSPRLKPCGNFTNGSCRNGNNCQFAHVCKLHATIIASSPKLANTQNNSFNSYEQSQNEPENFPVASTAIWESPGGIKIFTGSHDGFWRLWNTTNFSKEFEHNMSGGHVEALEIANNFLFVGFEAQSILLPDVKVGMIHAWNLATPTNPPLEFHIQTDLMPYAHSVCVTALKVVNGDVIVSGDRHGVIRLWKFDGTKFALTTTLHGHAGEITSLVMIDQLLWSSSVDRSIRLWDLSNNGVCKYLITRDTKSNGNPVGHTNAVTGLLTFNMPNNGGTFVLSSSLDGTIKAWNGTNGECVASEAHGEGVVSMALSEDQNKNPLLLVGLERGNIMVRNVLQTAKAPAFCLLFTLSSKYTASHIGSVKTIREGPSSTFYTGGNDGKLMVWQISGDLGI